MNNQIGGAPIKRPVARGTIGGGRQGKAVPVTIQPQAHAKAMPAPPPRPMRAPQPRPVAPRAPMPQPVKKSRKLGGFLVALFVLVAIGFVGYQVLSEQMKGLLDTPNIYQGIQFEGAAFGGKSKNDLIAYAKKQEKTKGNSVLFNVVLEGKDPVPVKLSALSPAYNTDQAVEEAYKYGRDGDRISRYISVLNLESDPQNFIIDYQVSDESIAAFVETLRGWLETEMSNATVDFRPDEEVMFVVKGGKNGVAIDGEKLRSDIKAAVNSRSNQDIRITATVKKPKVSEEEAMANTKLISQFSTTTTGEYNRDTNIKLASKAFNGVIVQPGETFSINDCTGKRTTAKGYRAAGAIKNGKLIQEPGGGVCQVSTTLYGAVIRADLEIVTRHNHRWPSTYVPIGQDAAIDYPSADFKFKNNSDSPVYLRSTKVGTKLTVYIYGKPIKWEKIEVVSQKTGSLYPAKTKTIVDKSLAPGQRKTDTSSKVGSTAVAYRVYYLNGKEDHREKLPDSRYNPVQGIIRVGPSS